MRFSARRRRIWSAVSIDCRTSMVSAPNRWRNSMRMRLISSLASRIATIVIGTSSARISAP
jgi:hypothetical protein